MSRTFPIMVALFASMSASCIFSEPARFEPPPNTPPSIDTSATPTVRIFRATTGAAVSGDGGPTNAFDFDVTILDGNVDQSLEYRVYVDWAPSEPRPSRSSGQVPRVASGDRTRRPLRFTVDRVEGLGALGCHWVELLVTTDFAGDSREPATPGDIATASWFVMTTNTTDGVVDVGGCLAQGDL